MKNLFYILLFTISACSPDTDYQLLEESTSTEAEDSMDLEAESNLNQDTASNEINMMVNSSTVNCSGEMEGTCLLVQEGDMIGTENWENFYYYDRIEGFNYEAGFVYELIVKKTNVETPLGGGSSIKYELVKIVSKELPETTVPENATEISNVTELIAGLKSDRNLYLKPGKYILPNRLIFQNNISNLQVTGADGAEITGDSKTLMWFQGTAKNIKFNNIKFSAYAGPGTADYGAGLVDFSNSAEDIFFENCTFTNPEVSTNGIKFVSEGTARSKNINIQNCTFVDIGRMAIELQNHTHDGILRFDGVTIQNNEFKSLGLQSQYGMAISLSGAGKNAVLSNNNIIDAKDRGIEILGYGELTIADNTFSAPNTAYNVITLEKDGVGEEYTKNVLITGNSGTVQGDEPHLIEIRQTDGLVYIVQYTFYSGSTGNTLRNNTLRNEGQGGNIYNDIDGGNTNLD
ncbi:parallel beta-helix repeat (two copies) [Salegentibacter holothuriorum]|uniref:Parallel beta-helix repeat (Two copies) n=1 Tax=Salegentibacter holothuriorum TaxID=241145 RepID=A0A1T5CS59_9FLAO|nr:DUF4377 domain-containing protein [Salegentibacter holothuriorum]SKB62151.1 parallel beta-helix repeat (two copies) [Salegentibacter holothuriorum]